MADLTATTTGLAPFAYYRLNEASGTVATDTQGHSNGTYAGTYTLGAPPNTANDVGSVKISGAGDVTTNLLATDAGLTGANFSVSFFFTSATATPAYGRFIANGHIDTSDKGFQIYSLPGGAVQIDVRNTAIVTAQQNAGAWAVGTLIHVVAVVDAANTRTLVYVNGTAGTAAGYQSMAAAAYVTAIGFNPAYSGDYANGTISEVSFYNYALTAANVTALYAARTVASGTTGTVPANATAFVSAVGTVAASATAFIKAAAVKVATATAFIAATSVAIAPATA